MPALKQIAGIEKTTEVNESLRPSQITEKKIQKVIEVLLDEYTLFLQATPFFNSVSVVRNFSMILLSNVA